MRLAHRLAVGEPVRLCSFDFPYSQLIWEVQVLSRRDCRVCGLVILLMAGCSSQKDDASAERIKAMAGGELKKVVPVSGKVLLDGQPKEGISIVLYPDPPTGVVAGEVRTKSDGTYCWGTYGECDGIAPGKYKVTFRLIPKPRRNDNVSVKEDQLKGKYSDPLKSKFVLEVKEGSPQTNVDYDLKTK